MAANPVVWVVVATVSIHLRKMSMFLSQVASPWGEKFGRSDDIFVAESYLIEESPRSCDPNPSVSKLLMCLIALDVL